MLNYELAKQLKDAGFKCEGYFGVTENNKLVESDSEYGWVAAKEGNYLYEDFQTVIEIPTLSELIEACGENFGTLSQYSFPGTDGNKFLASCQYKPGDIQQKYTDAEGSTPEEAVARLWLALNKKDNRSSYWYAKEDDGVK